MTLMFYMVPCYLMTFVEVNLRGLLELGEKTSIFVNIWVSLASPELTPSFSRVFTWLSDDVSSLGWHLKELHVAWAQLEKERTRLRLYTNYLEKSIQCVKTASSITSNDDLEPDDESVDTLLVSPFRDLDDDSYDGEVLNELEEYGNAGELCRQRAVNSFDRDDLAFQCMIGFRKFVAYFDPFLPMNIITRKAYNTIMVKGLESTWKNLVAIVRDVYVFVGSFTYIMDYVILEDIGEFILRDMAEVVMGKTL
ncbi:hypothetical protein Tco_1055568 [Tanacetum coccineum]|uniref:Uncharacterized protein n=1 Tax=Tanacetum coccineum TaxID=301880 RepID=A0ABQ5H022_9ASTR